MTRKYVVNPHTAWEEYFKDVKEWKKISRSFWEHVHNAQMEEYVKEPCGEYYVHFNNITEQFGRYYAFLHHQYQIIYEE